MPSSDHDAAALLDRARTALEAAGGGDLPPRPWQHRGRPLSDTELVRLAAWVARDADSTDPHLLRSGLHLLDAARAELDQVEAALLFAARAAGMTWPQVAVALGLGSAQAAQQRLNRILTRLDGPGDGDRDEDTDGRASNSAGAGNSDGEARRSSKSRHLETGG
ncbi:hypothetical protein [Kineococcus radiotolerans]|uniref:DNA-binding protein n=1 Tax=Kineococcus radiotolerans (strain ATCC BAA-149 / DSM 14245 / SRS30216) TaxID=266940 RepID=A6WAS4_KINRD|nr:hypothetical protein [Kineococcus radiotolerans]ABS03913.1 hypothetical protein Krad_2433 [Kineococcus radiotolerans SRS30216 = ATCC BAA-149]